MAEKKMPQKQSGKRAARQRPKVRNVSTEIGPDQALSQLSDLPDHPSAQATRMAAILQLQRQLGNAFVQRQLEVQAEEQEEGQEEVVELPDPKSINFELELDGHPFGQTLQREDGSGEEAAKTPTAVIDLELKDPKINRISEKKVQQKHGKENIAGYTKPKIKVSASNIKKHEINLTVKLTFVMDLASEYTGGRLQVLRDHENAHILIAEKVAKEYVVDPLKEKLEAMPDFSKANKPQITSKIQSAMADFKQNEGDESQAFDDIDYPRMADAYFGVATSLADLSSGSAEVKNMVTAMDAFKNNAKTAAGDAGAFGKLTQAIADAQAALGDTNLARLQYNQEFKDKVAAAQNLVDDIKKQENLSEEIKAKLDTLNPELNKFTWQPEI